jgi:hypothetical protein
MHSQHFLSTCQFILDTYSLSDTQLELTSEIEGGRSNKVFIHVGCITNQRSRFILRIDTDKTRILIGISCTICTQFLLNLDWGRSLTEFLIRVIYLRKNQRQRTDQLIFNSLKNQTYFVVLNDLILAEITITLTLDSRSVQYHPFNNN